MKFNLDAFIDSLLEFMKFDFGALIYSFLIAIIGFFVGGIGAAMLTMAFSYLLILAYKKFHKIFQEMEEEVKKTKLENEEKEDHRLLELEKEKQ